MKWILRVYEIFFKLIFKMLQGIERVKERIAYIIDGFFYQFIVAMLSLFVLFYRDIGDRALEWGNDWLRGEGLVMTPEMSLILLITISLPLLVALLIHGGVHRFMRWRGKEEQFRTYFSSQEKVLSHGITLISIISMVAAFSASGVRASDINMGALIFTVIFFYMSVINEFYSVIAFEQERKGYYH